MKYVVYNSSSKMFLTRTGYSFKFLNAQVFPTAEKAVEACDKLPIEPLWGIRPVTDWKPLEMPQELVELAENLGLQCYFDDCHDSQITISDGCTVECSFDTVDEAKGFLWCWGVRNRLEEKNV